MAEAGWDEVRARRLARSSLHERTSGDRVVELVSTLCGVHAQVQTSAGLQLATRLEDLTEADLRAELWEERTLVKAWTVRGTLHLHPAEELPLWLAARRAALGSTAEGLPAWRDPGGVTHPALEAREVDAGRAAVRDALDGCCLLREELAAAVVERVGDGPRERLRSGFAFFFDDLCQGPPQGSRITLARPDQWIAGWREVTDEREALREVCRRFIHAYGPTRPTDFREWFSGARLTADVARALFDELAGELEEIDVGGRRRFVLAGDTAFPEPASQVRLLPEYDVYVMGFRERDQLVPDAVRELIARHGRGRYEGPAGVRLVLVDGIAAGLWERRRRGRRIELDVRLARRLAKRRRAELEHEAERFGAFLGLEPLLRIETG
ncbi:MAG: winged helix DNA-binding domain-containing protein [Gaiellaceae bacterium]